MKLSLGKLLEASDSRNILLLVLLSVLFKAVLLANVTVVNPDGVRYVNSAYQLWQGNLQEAFSHEKMLFYSLTLGAFQRLFGDWFWAGKILSSFFLTLALVPLYLLAKEVFHRRAALWTGLVFLLLPAANGMATEIIKGGPFLFFILSAAFFAVKALKTPKPFLFFLVFVCVAAAALYRLEGILFIPTFIMAVLAVILAARENRRLYLKGLAAFFALPLTGLVFFAVFLMTGVISVGSLQVIWDPFAHHYFNFDFLRNYHLIYDHLKSMEGLFHGGEWGHDFFEIARHNMAWIYLWGMFLKFFKEFFPVFLIPLAVGLAVGGKFRADFFFLSWIAFSYLAMNYYFIILNNFMAGRYLMVAVLFLLPVVGCGLDYIASWVSGWKYSRTGMALLTLLFLIYPASKSLADSMENRNEIRACARWFQENPEWHGKKIITMDDRVLLHAGIFRDDYSYFSSADLEGLGNFAMETEGEVLVVRVPNKEPLPSFSGFTLTKKFKGDKSSLLIFTKMPRDFLTMVFTPGFSAVRISSNFG